MSKSAESDHRVASVKSEIDAIIEESDKAHGPGMRRTVFVMVQCRHIKDVFDMLLENAKTGKKPTDEQALEMESFAVDVLTSIISGIAGDVDPIVASSYADRAVKVRAELQAILAEEAKGKTD